MRGVATGNMGVGKDGQPTDHFQLGMELHAKYTLFAEGARGHLGKQLDGALSSLREGKDPQVYGIGIKELWEIDPDKHKPGLVIHTAGWPLDNDTYGGSFLYHMDNNQVVGRLCRRAWLTRIRICRRSRNSSATRPIPSIRAFLEGGKRISYGARAITAGGLQCRCRSSCFPGGALVGDDAGFLNASRIKGSHAAIKSGMMAAEAAFDALAGGAPARRTDALSGSFDTVVAHDELHRARNFKQWMSKGLYTGTFMVGLDQILFGGNAPWTLHHKHADHETLKQASQSSRSSTRSPTAC